MNALNGSEGARDALLPASPVPERKATASVDRKFDRPAISCTGLLGLLFLCVGQIPMRTRSINGLTKLQDILICRRKNHKFFKERVVVDFLKF